MTQTIENPTPFQKWYMDNYPNPLECGHAIEAEKVWQAALSQQPVGEWQPIETAPKDGTDILLRVGTRYFEGRWESIDDYPCWVSTHEDDHPVCWTDGVCWSINESEEPSEQPTHWQPLLLARFTVLGGK